MERKQSLTDLIRTSKEIVLGNPNDINIYKKLDDRILDSSVFCAFLLQKQPNLYNRISDRLKRDIKFNIKIFNELEDEFLFLIKYTHVSVQKDKNFYSRLEDKNKPYKILNHVCKEVIDDVQNLLSILERIEGRIITESKNNLIESKNNLVDFIPKKYRDNEELMFKLIQANSYCILAVSKRLQNDKNFIIKVITSKGSAAELIPDFYKKDISFLEKSIIVNPKIFYDICHFEILGLPENMLKILKAANVSISSIEIKNFYNKKLSSNVNLFNNREFMDELFKIVLDEQDDKHPYLCYYDEKTRSNDLLLTKEEKKVIILIYGMIAEVKKWEYSKDAQVQSFNNEEEYENYNECLSNVIYLLLDMYNSNKLQNSLCMKFYNTIKNSDSFSFKVNDFETDCMRIYNIPLNEFYESFYNLETINSKDINYKKLSSFRLIHNYLINEWTQNKQNGLSFLKHAKKYKRVHFNKRTFESVQNILFQDEEFLFELSKINSDYLKLMSDELKKDLDFAKKMIIENSEYIKYFSSEIADQLLLDNKYSNVNFYSSLSNLEKCKKTSILRALEFNEDIENIFSKTNLYNARLDDFNLLKDEDILRATFKNNSLNDSIFYDKEKNILDTTKLATLINADVAFTKKLILDNDLFKMLFCQN